MDDHEGSVRIGGRLITTFRFADDIVVNAGRRGRRNWRPERPFRYNHHKVQNGDRPRQDKTKVMTNNPNGFQREFKTKDQRLEEVGNFKYLGAIISNEGSKSEILSRIAQTTTALSRLKIIWRDKNISLAFKVKLMRTLILSTFLYVCESWTLTAEIERRIQAKPWYRSPSSVVKYLNILFKNYVHFLHQNLRCSCSRQRNPKHSSLTSFPGPDKSHKHQFYICFSIKEGLLVKPILTSSVKSLYQKKPPFKNWRVRMYILKDYLN